MRAITVESTERQRQRCQMSIVGEIVHEHDVRQLAHRLPPEKGGPVWCRSAWGRDLREAGIRAGRACDDAVSDAQGGGARRLRQRPGEEEELVVVVGGFALRDELVVLGRAHRVQRVGVRVVVVLWEGSRRREEAVARVAVFVKEGLLALVDHHQHGGAG